MTSPHPMRPIRHPWISLELHLLTPRHCRHLVAIVLHCHHHLTSVLHFRHYVTFMPHRRLEFVEI